MQIAVTGATGFLGRYLVSRLTSQGHTCRCWYRPASDRGGFESTQQQIEWMPGGLGQALAAAALVEGCQGVVHAALDHPGGGFRGGEGDVLEFVERNLGGTLQLFEAARQAGVARFVFISTCAVHEKILDDRPLDETHPLWPTSHYGAHKAAIEMFVHSYGLGLDFPICALRPTGIYGVARPIQQSKWFDLVRAVAEGADVDARRGGKEVHAADVARAVEILLTADGVAGQAYNCYDRYVSEHEVAVIAKDLSGSRSRILGAPTQPKHQIATDRLRRLGMEFGGRRLLVETVGKLLDAT